jgi:DNA-binding response OmpR family regulator
MNAATALDLLSRSLVVPATTEVRTMAEILVIDDDAQMRRLLARILNGAGRTVHQATGGEAGLGLFHQVHPALVITDIVMPDMEGIELIRKLREDAPTIPILAISGGDHPLYLPAATGLGATAALAKPFAGDELLSLVRRLLGTV